MAAELWGILPVALEAVGAGAPSTQGLRARPVGRSPAWPEPDRDRGQSRVLWISELLRAGLSLTRLPPLSMRSVPRVSSTRTLLEPRWPRA